MKKLFTLIATAVMAVCANAQTITFSEAADAGTLDGKTFSQDGVVLTITDTGGKFAIDANSQYFGTADNYVNYSYRLKSGGKSSSKSSLKITIPSDGTLTVYARTGSSSATDRDIILTQNGETLVDKIILESEAVKATINEEEKNVYPAVSTPVKAGDVEITYPVGSINFYAFAFEASNASTFPEASTLAGMYTATQKGTSWLRTNDYSASELNISYDMTISVDGNMVTFNNVDNWNYTITGEYDQTTGIITCSPSVNGYYTAAGADATSTFTASVDKDGNITFGSWSWYYGEYSYENTTSMTLTKAVKLWETTAVVTWRDSEGKVFNNCIGSVSKYSGTSSEYFISGIGSKTNDIVKISIVDGAPQVDNAGYFYYVWQEENEDAWLEGNKNGIADIDGENSGHITFDYWHYLYNSESQKWSEDSEGTVVVTWGAAAISINSVNAAAKSSAIYDLSGRKIATPAKGFYIQNGKKYVK